MFQRKGGDTGTKACPYIKGGEHLTPDPASGYSTKKFFPVRPRLNATGDSSDATHRHGRVHGKKMGPSQVDDPVRLKRALVAGEGFEPSTFGLCIPLQLSLPGDSSLWSGLSLHPRTGFAAVRMPAIKSLHLLTNRAGSVSLARDYPATGFPEFDR